MGQEVRPANGLVIVAHPDDETLWAGGTILTRPQIQWFIISLCRGGDPDRAPRFFRVIQMLGAQGAMADLDDGPEQTPLPIEVIENTILRLLPEDSWDLLLTHALDGEYTRHRRHEEVSVAVNHLYQDRKLIAQQVWMFAYEDQQRKKLPSAILTSDLVFHLPDAVWHQKYQLINNEYGFSPESWEARTTPRIEAFWQLTSQTKST